MGEVTTFGTCVASVTLQSLLDTYREIRPPTLAPDSEDRPSSMSGRLFLRCSLGIHIEA